MSDQIFALFLKSFFNGIFLTWVTSVMSILLGNFTITTNSIEWIGYKIGSSQRKQAKILTGPLLKGSIYSISFQMISFT